MIGLGKQIKTPDCNVNTWLTIFVTLLHGKRLRSNSGSRFIRTKNQSAEREIHIQAVREDHFKPLSTFSLRDGVRSPSVIKPYKLKANGVAQGRERQKLTSFVRWEVRCERYL
jgi:hypothetical protein